ncbi:MAG: FAD:protein FMN transferase, partial [Eubacterium sp.]|nr:FAD:protein FMN transferase [Eubacterium sp.]
MEDTEPVSVDLFAMDTYMTFTAYGENAAEALEDATQSIKHIDELWSTGMENSQISMLNREKKMTVSPETYELIRRSVEFHESTQGVFDISVYPIMRAWGFTDQNYRVPSGEELKTLLSHVDSSQILCGDDGKTVTLQDPEMEIDLGGIAKGYASDMVMDILRGHGVEHAIINLGGNVKTLGSKPDGSDWRVGIVDPADESAYVGGVRMQDKAAITSGGYQRYFEE